MRLPLLGLLLLACAAPALAKRPDLNAFVNHKITDTASLVAQVRGDGEVADRYERHFAMDRAGVVAYLSTLHRGNLAQEGTYTIYSVPDDGHVKMHLGKLKRGLPVFLDARGRTILVAKCGNPVVRGPARARVANSLVAKPIDESGVRELTEEPLVPASETAESPDTLLAVAPPVPESVPLALTPSTPLEAPAVPAIASIGATATGGGGFPFLALLPLGGLGFIHSGDGSDGRINPVPEPTTMVAVGLGVAGLMRRRRSDSTRARR